MLTACEIEDVSGRVSRCEAGILVDGAYATKLGTLTTVNFCAAVAEGSIDRAQAADWFVDIFSVIKLMLQMTKGL